MKFHPLAFFLGSELLFLEEGAMLPAPDLIHQACVTGNRTSQITHYGL
jgi:hypothetical protein